MIAAVGFAVIAAVGAQGAALEKAYPEMFETPAERGYAEAKTALKIISAQ